MRCTPSNRLAALLLAGVVGSAVNAAHAEGPAAPASAPASTGSDAYPVIQTLLPTEVAFLRTNASLFVNYGQPSLGRASVDALLMGLDAHMALLDRIQVGLRLPFLQYSGAGNVSSTELGDLQLQVKGQLWRGGSAMQLAVAAFINGLLPTGTGRGSRDYGFLQPGAAISGRMDKLSFSFAGSGLVAFSGQGGGAVQFQSMGIIDLFGAYSVLPWMNAQLAMQFGFDDKIFGASILPALQFHLMKKLHVDLGARIALNDEGKLFSLLSRAMLVFAVGGVF